MPIPFFASPPNRHHLLGVCVFQAPTAELGSHSRKYPLADHGAFELSGGELGVWDIQSAKHCPGAMSAIGVGYKPNKTYQITFSEGNGEQNHGTLRTIFLPTFWIIASASRSASLNDLAPISRCIM
jgi:hypothetical protein